LHACSSRGCPLGLGTCAAALCAQAARNVASCRRRAPAGLAASAAPRSPVSPSEPLPARPRRASRVARLRCVKKALRLNHKSALCGGRPCPHPSVDCGPDRRPSRRRRTALRAPTPARPFLIHVIWAWRGAARRPARRLATAGRGARPRPIRPVLLNGASARVPRIPTAHRAHTACAPYPRILGSWVAAAPPCPPPSVPRRPPLGATLPLVLRGIPNFCVARPSCYFAGCARCAGARAGGGGGGAGGWGRGGVGGGRGAGRAACPARDHRCRRGGRAGTARPETRRA
jgi:hypothetical protein